MKVIVVDLDTPLRHAGGEVHELRLAEPEAQKMFMVWRHIEAGENPESSALFARDLVAKASGLPEAAIGALPVSVMGAAADQVSDAIAAELEGFEFDESQTDFMLSDPVMVGNIEYVSLPIREPTADEVIKANSHLRTSQGPASQMKYRMSLVSQVTGVPIANVHRFPVTVVMKAAQIIEGFSAAGRRTGAS